MIRRRLGVGPALLAMGLAHGACSSDGQTSTPSETGGAATSGGGPGSGGAPANGGTGTSAGGDAGAGGASSGGACASCDGGASGSDVTALQAVQNPANVLSYYVSWKTSVATPTSLGVDCGPDYVHEFTGTAATTQHEVFILGLFGGARCTLTASSGPGAPSRSVQIDVEPPPTLPEFTVTVAAGQDTEPGFTLMNLSNESPPEQPGAAALMDEKGRYRWYYQRGADPGPDDDVQLTPEGVLIGSRPPVGPMIVDWEGKVVWRGGFEMHHSIVQMPNEQFLYLYDSAEGCPKEAAGVVARWDRPTATKVWEWRLCEHFLPPDEFTDWSHLNHIEPYPDGSAFLISSRNQSQVYKVSFATGEILWTLGGTLGAAFDEGGDFTMSRDDRFITQHAPKLLPNGHIVLFDNGIQGLRQWSRGLELEIDETAKTARAVWQFRPQPDIYSAVWGYSERLEGGGTLMTFGQRLDTEGSHLIETGPDGKTVVWRVDGPPHWGIYRSLRVAPPTFGWVSR